MTGVSRFKLALAWAKQNHAIAQHHLQMACTLKPEYDRLDTCIALHSHTTQGGKMRLTLTDAHMHLMRAEPLHPQQTVTIPLPDHLHKKALTP